MTFMLQSTMPSSSTQLDGSYALITKSQRKISSLIPDVLIEEIATDTLRITDHPVETGAAISDHAFKMPPEIVMRCGWTDSGQFEGYSAMIYSQLLQLQEQREPFEVSTPFRQYKNMLISFLNKTADETVSHAMYLTVGMRYVHITGTTVTPGQTVGASGLAQSGINNLPSSGGSPSFGSINPANPYDYGNFGGQGLGGINAGTSLPFFASANNILNSLNGIAP